MTEVNSLQDLLPVVSEEGEVLYETSRMQSMPNALALYNQVYQDDEPNRINRMRLQLILDGFPPRDPVKQRMMGLADEANINVGMLKGILADASRPLVDQVNGVERLVNIAYRQEGDEDLDDWAKIVAEEHFNTVTKDEDFDYHFRTQELVRQFVTHGVTVPYYPDNIDWRWDSEPIGKFLIPKDTKASETYVSLAFMERRVDPSYLAERWKNGNDKWNKDAIYKVLKSAAPEKTADSSDYEDWERAWKENDYWLDTIIPKINIVHMWVKELNGKISKFLFAKKGCTEFLYEDKFAFDSTSQAFQMMTYGVGTTGTYHGIRGLAYDAVPLVLEINRTVSSFIDGIRRQGKMYLQPSDVESLQNIVMIEKAGYTIVPPGFNQLTSPVPNFAQGVIPGIQVLQGFLTQNVSSYAVESGGQMMGGDARKTKAEVMARIQQIAAASGGNAELFSKSWSRLILEQLRRMLRKNYQEKEPGGKAIKEFRKRCEDRGVPEDFWDKIDLPRCSAVPAVGAGSASQQMMVMEMLLDFSNRGFFDAQGQQSLQRDAVRLATGSNEAVKIYCGEGDVGRPMQDHRNALFQNDLIALGKPQPVLPNDNHQVHAEIHLGASGAEFPTSSIADHIQALQVATQENDEETILALTPVMEMMVQHTAEHVQLMKDAPLAAMYREQLQSVTGTMVNIQRAAQRILRQRRQEQEKAMQEQAAAEMEQMVAEASQQRDAGQDYWQVANLAKTDMALEENNAKFQQTFRHKEEDHAQKMRIRDQETAQKLALEQAKAASKVVAPTV